MSTDATPEGNGLPQSMGEGAPSTLPDPHLPVNHLAAVFRNACVSVEMKVP
jgi:hypothetical protein